MTKEEVAAALIDSIEGLGAQKVAKFCDDGFKGSYVVLKAVRLGSGELCAADLARALHVSTARITVALNSLERKGQICRDRGPGDGRRTHLSVTPAGEEALRIHEAEMVEQVVGMMDRLTDEEAQQLLTLVQKL